jgi:hypothetical protein
MKLSKEELDKLIAEAPKNDKGQPVIPEDIFMDNYKDLPTGTRSDKGKYAKDGGYLNPPAKGSEDARQRGLKGGAAAAETYLRRKTFAESITILLNKKFDDGTTMQDKIVAAMADKAMDGCVGAFEALRDTVGEKPTDQVSLDVMSDGDRELIENLKKRINEQSSGTKK